MPTATSRDAEELNPAPLRHVAADHQIGPAEILVTLLQVLHHAANIVRPLLAVVGHDRRIEGKFVNFVAVIRGDYSHMTIVAFRTADHRLVVDGTRQDKTVVIVGVLADQINAARRRITWVAG